MKHVAWQAPRLPRKTKKALLKYAAGKQLTRRERRRIRSLDGSRSLADLGPECNGFVFEPLGEN